MRRMRQKWFIGRAFRGVVTIRRPIASVFFPPVPPAHQRFHQRRQRRLRAGTRDDDQVDSWPEVGDESAGTLRAAGVSSGCEPPPRRLSERPKAQSADASDRWMAEHDNARVGHAYPPAERPLKIGGSPDAVVREESLIHRRVTNAGRPAGSGCSACRSPEWLCGRPR